jgi:purine-nucleoside phosphorylase
LSPTRRRDGQSTLTLPLYEQLHVTVSTIRAHIGSARPTLGLVLGSGLGSFANELRNAQVLEYSDIPHFPVSAVEGHAGRLVVGDLHGVTVAAMQGRVHFYEGHDLVKVTYPIRSLILLGAKTLVVTNAAGGVNPELTPGELVLIADHLNFFPEGPLRGGHDERLGPRFPDMTRAYAPELRELARRAGASLGMKLREGVYAGLAGPSYETPAEVRMLRTLGADLVGMSTVPEVVVANHQGARVLGISCVTNLAAGITGQRLTHDEVTETAARVRKRFAELLSAIIATMGREGVLV